jgi:hypothetical protein
VVVGDLKDCDFDDPPGRMLLELRRMDMIAVAKPNDEDNCVAPEVKADEEDMVEAEGESTVVGAAVGVVVPVTVGTFRVNAVGRPTRVEVGAGSRVPGVTITAWAVRAVLQAKISIFFTIRCSHGFQTHKYSTVTF